MHMYPRCFVFAHWCAYQAHLGTHSDLCYVCACVRLTGSRNTPRTRKPSRLVLAQLLSGFAAGVRPQLYPTHMDARAHKRNTNRERERDLHIVLLKQARAIDATSYEFTGRAFNLFVDHLPFQEF